MSFFLLVFKIFNRKMMQRDEGNEREISYSIVCPGDILLEAFNRGKDE
jgi:hypothetical protein